MRERGKTELIDNDTYCVGQLPARKALRICGEILKMVAPAIGAASDGKSFLDKEINSESIANIAQMFANNLDSDKIDEIVIEFSRYTTVNGKELDLDFHFQGRIPTMLKWIKFCLEVNFADFFPAITALSSKMEKAE